MYSNFAFIEERFPKTFHNLATAERSIRINQAVNEIRYALEDFVVERLEELGIGDLFDKYKQLKQTTKMPVLQEQIALCHDKDTLQELGWENAKPILPKLNEKISCKLMSGRTDNLDAYDFLRRYGNSKGHTSQPYFLKINYRVSVRALQTFHSILQKICAEDSEVPMEISPFDENRMPIQGQEHLYEIDSYMAPPPDAPMSKCQVEFDAHFKRSGSQKRTNYALIRQYAKQDVKNIFLHRNIDTVQKTQEVLINELPPCMVRPVEISPIENQNSPFYIVAYHFQEKPHALSNELLQSLDMKNRLFICGELAKCMSELHQMGIYHRLLSHASVYVCDYSARGKGWRPHLVKFDFAKLVANNGGNALATVKEHARRAKEEIKDRSIQKYIPDEWDLEDWEKVDVYSLGILFCDILSGVISPDYDAMSKAMKSLGKSKEISGGLLNVLGAMISRAVAKRPAAADVQRALQEEMAAWN